MNLLIAAFHRTEPDSVLEARIRRLILDIPVEINVPHPDHPGD